MWLLLYKTQECDHLWYTGNGKQILWTTTLQNTVKNAVNKLPRKHKAQVKALEIIQHTFRSRTQSHAHNSLHM